MQSWDGELDTNKLPSHDTTVVSANREEIQWQEGMLEASMDALGNHDLLH